MIQKSEKEHKARASGIWKVRRLDFFSEGRMKSRKKKGNHCRRAKQTDSSVSLQGLSDTSTFMYSLSLLCLPHRSITYQPRRRSAKMGGEEGEQFGKRERGSGVEENS